MAEAKRAMHPGGERDVETAGGTRAAVVTLLLPESLDLDRPKTLRADELFHFDGRRRQVRAALQILPEHMPGEGLRRSVTLVTVDRTADIFFVAARPMGLLFTPE